VIQTTWKVDLLVAAAIAAVILIVEPGVAIGGMLALLLVMICAVSFVFERRRRRRRPRVRARSR
jgi:hypothetical protein